MPRIRCRPAAGVGDAGTWGRGAADPSRGMTLVELLAAVAVTGILLMAYAQIFLSGNASAAFITDMDELVDAADDGLLGWPHLRGIVTQTRMGRNVVNVETNRLTVLVADTTLEYSLSGKDLI